MEVAMEEPSDLVQVKLCKQEESGLGFFIKKRNSAPYAEVTQVSADSAAARYGLVREGDTITHLNGIDVSKMDFDSINQMIRGIATGTSVDLVLKCAKGQMTYLKTVSRESGCPFAMRVTEKIRVQVKEKVEEKVEEKAVEKEKPKAVKKFERIRCLLDENVHTDTLHNKGYSIGCTDKICVGSLMMQASKRPPGTVRPKAELLEHARDFIDQFYGSIKRLNSVAHQKRMSEVLNACEKFGSYELTSAELIFGCKQAWRNAIRCIGRIQWSKLQVFDCRNIRTPKAMYDALCRHLLYATNKGNIRSAITVFPHRTDGQTDFRMWNAQMIKYAGYRQPDGTVIGDPMSVDFTELCMKLGWKGTGGRFDVLPWVLQAEGNDPEYFDIPKELILEVEIEHPTYPWFKDLGFKWYTVPAVANMMLDCGGLEFTACPFNGWYMGTEIGARNLCDPNRYNVMEEVARKMGLNTNNVSSLWKDKAAIECNIAVLHSFQRYNVTISDHHAAAESFMKHLANEQRLRGGCPSDWVWVVPPISGSLTPVFHQEMLNYKVYPFYEYQTDAWKTHVWQDKSKSLTKERSGKKIRFKDLARAVKFAANLMGKALAARIKATILYATETGKSETFAKQLCDIFNHAFDARVLCMEDYDIAELEHEQLVLVVTSTFGNGDPPENGEALSQLLYEMMTPANKKGKASSKFQMGLKKRNTENDMKEKIGSLSEEAGVLHNLRYSIFALGSRAYPNYCAFGHCIDRLLSSLGAECVMPTGEGDELCGQEQAFQAWAKAVFLKCCDEFCAGDEMNIRMATGSLEKSDMSWGLGKFRLTEVKEKEPGIMDGLSHLHKRKIYPSSVTYCKNLQAPASGRETILVKLDTESHNDELVYRPGDHVAIYPANDPKLVEDVMKLIANPPPADTVFKLEKSKPPGPMTPTTWHAVDKFPVLTVKTALSRYLDLTTPPSQNFLKQLQKLATDEKEKAKLNELIEDAHAYEDWKSKYWPTIAEVMAEFPSAPLSASFLLTQLPVMQQRYYSISSSPSMFPGEIHATVAVVNYNTEGGKGRLRHGVCSTWLNTLKAGDEVPCFVRAAPSFRMPEDETSPVVMIGPGTGIAPFRSFWQQRKIDMETKAPPKSDSRNGWGDMSLYFGCRNSKMDHIYRDETAEAHKAGALKENHCALSREPNLPKTYVQDILKKNGSALYSRIMEGDGHVYVCGDVSMADQVNKTLEEIWAKQGKVSREEAAGKLLALRDQNRYHEDIFGVTLRTTEVKDRLRDQSKKIWRESSQKSFEKATLP